MKKKGVTSEARHLFVANHDLNVYINYIVRTYNIFIFKLFSKENTNISNGGDEYAHFRHEESNLC